MVSIGDISPKVAKERRAGIIAEQNHNFFAQKTLPMHFYEKGEVDKQVLPDEG
jgi:hypothetical protein